MEKYKFKIGDKVVVVKTDFTEEEWTGIGKVNVEFKIGDEFIIKDIAVYGKGVYIDFVCSGNCNYTYPVSGFKLIKQEPENLDYLIDIFSKLDIK